MIWIPIVISFVALIVSVIGIILATREEEPETPSMRPWDTFGPTEL